MPDMTRFTLRAVAGLVLAATLAACGPAAPAPTALPSAEAPSQLPSATSSAAQASPTSKATPAGSAAVPSPGATNALTKLLPAELGGAATQRLAISGSDMGALDPAAAMIFISVLAQLGAEGKDMTAAAALNGRGSILAIQVAGKTAQEVNDAMIAGRTLNATTTKDELDISGKHVLKVTTSIAPIPFYMYASENVSFTVAGADDSVVTEAFSKLP